ncbi:MAG TPA: DNA-binding response regulator [Verrucomicrobia bacterium]|nr:MAG: DNA-binding response regulator [Lentisphaerae bacterium GWF2_57_35]HBA83962.1 DNA-binding response regulator [Verrucomicrobiota bacterium]
MIRVLIVDDHPIFRQGLKQVLSDDPGIVVAGEAGNGREALQLMRSQSYDVVTLDISIPDIGGMDILKQIKSERSDLKLLMLSIYPEEQFAIRALKAGASGYLTKNSVPDELVTAIQKVAAGSTYVTASLAQKLAFDVQDRTAAKQPHESLSDREFEILRLLGRGLTVSEIADRLRLSVKTVSTHRAHILTKMHLDNNAQLIKYAIDRQLVE